MGNAVIPGRLARKRGNEGGSSTVEFTLAALPLFAVLFLTMDLAWTIFGWACIQEGAREGVRYAVTCSGQPESSLDSATSQVVLQHSFGFATASNINVDYYPSTGYSSAGVPANVDGRVGATAAGNLVKVTVKSVVLRSFSPVYRAFSPQQLSASASDILQ